MKIIIILFITSSLSAMNFTATPLPEDGNYLEQPEDENRYLAQYLPEDREFILSICEKYLIPIKFLYRLHYIESRLGKYNIRHENNGTKSIGFAQINDSNLEYFSNKYNNGVTIDLYDKYQNIEIGAIYLRHLYERLNGNWVDALISYNFGITRFRRGDTIPDSTMEYVYLIMWGKDYMPYVEILTKAMIGLI